MQVYYVYDEKKDDDFMVIPEKDCLLPVDRNLMETFISVKPDFSKLEGQDLKGLPPATMGTVVASRNEDGDVCVVDMPLWHQRMAALLGGR